MPADLEHPHPAINATRARQGRWGKHVFWVLVISTVLAAAALFGAWGLRSGDIARVEHTRSATAAQEAEHYSTGQAPVKQTPSS
ncbi:MAG TPA: hypothetical protein VNZ85_11920 [Caulobacter sp.]|nr:hypothetical protein [Caulobacter sp.]